MKAMLLKILKYLLAEKSFQEDPNPWFKREKLTVMRDELIKTLQNELNIK